MSPETASSSRFKTNCKKLDLRSKTRRQCRIWEINANMGTQENQKLSPIQKQLKPFRITQYQDFMNTLRSRNGRNHYSRSSQKMFLISIGPLTVARLHLENTRGSC